MELKSNFKLALLGGQCLTNKARTFPKEMSLRVSVKDDLGQFLSHFSSVLALHQKKNLFSSHFIELY